MLRRSQAEGTHSLQGNVPFETVFVYSGHNKRLQLVVQREQAERSAACRYFPGELLKVAQGAYSISSTILFSNRIRSLAIESEDRIMRFANNRSYSKKAPVSTLRVCYSGNPLSSSPTREVLLRRNRKVKFRLRIFLRSFSLFQFPSKWYCFDMVKDDTRAGKYHQLCLAFLDEDLKNDVRCASIAVNQYGFRIREGWEESCLYKELDHYLERCAL